MRHLAAFLHPGGRRARLEYWRAVALVPMVALAVLLATLLAFTSMLDVGMVNAVYLPLSVIAAAGLWASLVIGAQRLHDRDRSGWWVLIAVVPVVGTLWWIWNGLRPGTAGPNRFGPDPLGGAISDVFDEAPTPRPRRKPPVISTIAAWIALVAVVMVTILLFQDPRRHASRIDWTSLRALAKNTVTARVHGTNCHDRNQSEKELFCRPIQLRAGYRA